MSFMNYAHLCASSFCSYSMIRALGWANPSIPTMGLGYLFCPLDVKGQGSGSLVFFLLN